MHAPFDAVSRGIGWARVSVVRMVKEMMRNLDFIVWAKEGTKGAERFEGKRRLGQISEH